ncbi:hypothetical protein KO361_00360 [Candidatus Woesearchaeota archaeon]|nr:hypothetical protein [Candidatus Woesearchaeota archaeon]
MKIHSFLKELQSDLSTRSTNGGVKRFNHTEDLELQAVTIFLDEMLKSANPRLDLDTYYHSLNTVINSPYLELVENKILGNLHDLFPFSKNPETVSATFFKNALPYYEKHPESELANCMQKIYLDELSKKLTNSKNILHNNMQVLLENKLEEIGRYETTLAVNASPEKPKDYDYKSNFFVLGEQLRNGSPDPGIIKWFYSKIRLIEADIIKYDVPDLKYAISRSKEYVERKYSIERKSFGTKDFRCE